MIKFIASVAVLISLATYGGVHEPREWTSAKGDKINATFVSEKTGVVMLKMADGKTISIKMAALSDPDKLWISESSYIPKTFDFHTTNLGMPLLRTSDQKKNRSSIRDNITITTDSQGGSRKTFISEICVKELGSTLTNKYSKAIKTEGRFVCVHWTVKNLSANEDDINLPSISVKKDGWFKAKDIDDFVNMLGTHCEGRERENLHEKLSPKFSKSFCNIYEIPKDGEITQFMFFELGYKPSYVYVSLKPDLEYDKLTTWQKNQRDLP